MLTLYSHRELICRAGVTYCWIFCCTTSAIVAIMRRFLGTLARTMRLIARRLIVKQLHAYWRISFGRPFRFGACTIRPVNRRVRAFSPGLHSLQRRTASTQFSSKHRASRVGVRNRTVCLHGFLYGVARGHDRDSFKYHLRSLRR
jgi:hypothetical protein